MKIIGLCCLCFCLKKFSIKTLVLTRKHAIKQLARRSYKSFTTSVVNDKLQTKNMLIQVARTIKEELKKISWDKEGSFIKDEIAALQNFNWKSLLVHYEYYMPMLMQLLKVLIPNFQQREPLVCTLASQILKNWNTKMSLLQQAVSILLYGNGTKKQVWHWKLSIFYCMYITYSIIRSTIVFSHSCSVLHTKEPLCRVNQKW